MPGVVEFQPWRHCGDIASGSAPRTAATLSSEDLALINRHRSDANRLGFALMLCYLRFPGRILRRGEQPPAALCEFVAEQLGLDAAHFGDYADRDQTRREHVLEIETALGLLPVTRAMYRELGALLLPTALATDHGPTLQVSPRCASNWKNRMSCYCVPRPTRACAIAII